MDARIASFALFCSLCAGCTFGPVRRNHVDGLGRYADSRRVRVDVAGEGPPEVKQSLARSTEKSLARETNAKAAKRDDKDAFRLELHVTDARQPAHRVGEGTAAVNNVKDAIGLHTDPALMGHLAVRGELFAPDGRQVGDVEWQKAVDPARGAPGAGDTIGTSVGRKMRHRFGEYATRRAGDERLFLTPTELTMQKGAFSVSDEEVLAARVAVGVSDHVQLHMWGGGVPIPYGGAFGFVGGGILLAGAGGGALFGVLDVGLKWRFLDETARRPGMAISYDMLDAFGTGIGAGGALAVGDSVGGGGVVVTGGANLQFNVFSLTVGKHFFKNTHAVLGTYVLDNHHILPQGARFDAACGVAAASSSGEGAAILPCGSDSTKFDRVPTRVQPFASIDQPIGRWFSLGAELFPAIPVRLTTATTGARFLLGFKEPLGPLALDRIKLRIDVALAWAYLPADPGHDRPRGGPVYAPWIGAGFHFL